jgi:hypothetical protein
MNERILQLAAEAKIMTEDSINMKISFSTQLKAFSETFSKLIVQECMNIVKHNIYEPNYRGGSQILESFENYQANRRAEDIVNQIQKHFGVNE